MVERQSDLWRIVIFGRVLSPLLEIWGGFVRRDKVLRKKWVRAIVKDGFEKLYTRVVQAD
jgi:hypothetical protein